MVIKGVVYEDFVNYKRASMFVSFPSCTFKCCTECGIDCCQNSSLALSPNIEIDARLLVHRYVNNPITYAIVCGGLEPFDSVNDLHEFITEIRKATTDTIVVYTGYTEEEIEQNKDFNWIYDVKNVIIKYGRFIPNQEGHYDEVLGINLASDNQYAKGYNLF